MVAGSKPARGSISPKNSLIEALLILLTVAESRNAYAISFKESNLGPE
jgi:hypothetical protein